MNALQPLAQQSNPTGYTAAQISNAMRISKRAVLKALAHTPPAGSVIVHGNEAALWTFDVLPAATQSGIASHASANGLSIADYLDAFIRPWEPALPLAQIDDGCLETARKLRSALLPALERLDSKLCEPADRVRLGLEDYKRAFGHEVSKRHWPSASAGRRSS